MRSPLAALAVVFLLAGCSANEAGQAFLAPDGSARTALPVTPGTTAVIGLGSLEMVKAGDSAKVLSLNIEGDHVNDPAGRVLGVKVYPLTSSGPLGATVCVVVDPAQGCPT